MPDTIEHVRQLLEQEDPEFRELREQHHRFDARLAELYNKPYLSPDEELETVEIKKRKLLLKDRMEHMVRRYPRAHG
jgi:uncharacterized protein YdcH (DUF465 family)